MCECLNLSRFSTDDFFPFIGIDFDVIGIPTHIKHSNQMSNVRNIRPRMRALILSQVNK